MAAALATRAEVDAVYRLDQAGLLDISMVIATAPEYIPVTREEVVPVRRAARILSAVWAGWWVFFFVASGVSDLMMHGWTAWSWGALYPMTMLAFLVGCVVFAWRREKAGGLLLAAVGLVLLVIYPLQMRGPLAMVIPTMATLGLPPTAAGILFIVSARQRGRAA